MLSRIPAKAVVHINTRALSQSAPRLTTAVTRVDALVEKSTSQPDSSKISQAIKDLWYPQIGNRDIVGPSIWTSHDYHDTPDQPYPAVRFAENTSEVLALRAKEKGDWNSLTMEEKKQLYRNSFRQTFAEMNAPTGSYKRIFIHVFYIVGFSILYQLYFSLTCVPPKARAYSEEIETGRMQRMVMMGMNPVAGLASKYDYEKNEWKK
ncbi:cytochrome c oxidase subunit 4 isoform 1, mitochondrial-like [Dreissena polymorpha]|uniref:Cytochrome c oxidase subunit 4 n=1 Tax=Dreissena polymorpha TaxID=45954 RepID=A0A9D4E7E2_DREPO|nr:cytochrome c oxidase subunit 4 isoform 1, mitochondrial-like [Dreissena polymorpha]KAH3774488.1 hypothetical protein DPMN_175870 [Dreissena polymorpha]